jgi:hypothetical protein
MIYVVKDRKVWKGERRCRGRCISTHQTESLSDARIHNRHVLDLLVLEVSESSIGVTKHSLLFLVQLLARRQHRFVIQGGTHATSGRWAMWSRVQEEVAEEVC